MILSDGSQIEAALVVGADGIHSKVRETLKLPGEELLYRGLFVALGIVDCVVQLTERRVFETTDGTTRIYVMPFAKKSARNFCRASSTTTWQLSFVCPDLAAARQLAKNPAALREELVRRISGWHEPIPQLIRSTNLDAISGYPVWDREALDAAVLQRAAGGGTTSCEAADPGPRRVTLIVVRK